MLKRLNLGQIKESDPELWNVVVESHKKNTIFSRGHLDPSYLYILSFFE